MVLALCVAGTADGHSWSRGWVVMTGRGGCSGAGRGGCGWASRPPLEKQCTCDHCRMLRTVRKQHLAWVTCTLLFQSVSNALTVECRQPRPWGGMGCACAMRLAATCQSRGGAMLFSGVGRILTWTPPPHDSGIAHQVGSRSGQGLGHVVAVHPCLPVVRRCQGCCVSAPSWPSCRRQSLWPAHSALRVRRAALD